MSKSIVNTNPYPFHFEASQYPAVKPNGKGVKVEFDNCRGSTPSIKASRLRAMMQEAHDDPSKIVAHVCSYDALSSRLCEEAGFPIVFLAGYPMASAFGLPDTGYIAFGEVVNKIQEVVRATSVPIVVDGDTGYGGPMNVRRTVQGQAPMKPSIQIDRD
ncbi:methylisocitrate lyase [Fusarium albosuccineum]|uniref:Methylisocitrate lyase n=1 Tax=Fusarium albosuccineum TaxID=1237068 RepID=A0A8H4KKS3_9HYPO|nr:methylisocitrate lyase [Fusarium albosuccineum]